MSVPPFSEHAVVLTARDDSGWQLESVREGSAADVMGFCTEDVVRTIPALPLTDALARIKILGKLRKTSKVEATFVRAGEAEVSSPTIRVETAAAG